MTSINENPSDTRLTSYTTIIEMLASLISSSVDVEPKLLFISNVNLSSWGKQTHLRLFDAGWPTSGKVCVIWSLLYDTFLKVQVQVHTCMWYYVKISLFFLCYYYYPGHSFFLRNARILHKIPKIIIKKVTSFSFLRLSVQ
jgi:hypothetical protein